MSDAQSFTGSNLGNIRLLLGKQDNFKLSKSDANEVKYHPVDNENIWKVRFLQELIEIKQGDLTVDLDHAEIQEKFPLAPLGVLAPGSAHARPSARPPIDTSGNFSAHMSGRGETV